MILSCKILYFNALFKQMVTLDEACKAHPNARWWVKGDGCDIISGLEESVNCDWNGDVDHGDGQLQALYQMYMDRLKRVKNLISMFKIREILY